MKGLTIGVEVEFSGLTRVAAIETVAEHFGTTAYGAGGYNVGAKDNKNREWKIVRDTSIITDGGEQCELVTPVLKYRDIETLQEIIRKLRKAGAKVNESCGLHVHVSRADINSKGIANLMNIFASREELFFRALQVNEVRKSRYCKPVDKNFLTALNEQKPATLDELKVIWYGDDRDHDYHYHSSRYHAINLHSFFCRKTIEFRLFNGTLHAGEVKSYVQLCCALVAFAQANKKAIYRPINIANEKFAMRTFLTRMGLSGDEFKTLRHHLTKNLSGNSAWRFAC